MIDTIYIEREVLEHPRARTILERYPAARRIVCERYGEVFNRRSQNFRLQKQRPALVLARKFDHHVLPTPPDYGIGGQRNFYFSHMLNCVYDCRYCFLQGMFQSAHYVVFVNYEDFASGIDAMLVDDAETYFFSGYDCDSLVFDATTRFVDFIVPHFAVRPRAVLELRTKSVAVRPLLKHEALPNVVVAFSMVPDAFARAVEHGAPPVARRIAALRQLADAGWKLGLRFDPLLYHASARTAYSELFESVFAAIPADAVHSVSVGPLRFPKAMYDRIARLYPDDPLYNTPMTQQGGMMAYEPAIERDLQAFCEQALLQHVPRERLFACFPEVTTT